MAARQVLLRLLQNKGIKFATVKWYKLFFTF